MTLLSNTVVFNPVGSLSILQNTRQIDQGKCLLAHIFVPLDSIFEKQVFKPLNRT